jgi:hypothetical protein
MLDQQRTLERDGGIDRDLDRQHKRFAGDTCAAVHAVVA